MNPERPEAEKPEIGDAFEKEKEILNGNLEEVAEILSESKEKGDKPSVLRKGKLILAALAIAAGVSMMGVGKVALEQAETDPYPGAPQDITVENVAKGLEAVGLGVGVIGIAAFIEEMRKRKESETGHSE